MGITHKKIRNAVRKWSRTVTQRDIAARITSEYVNQGMKAPKLSCIEENGAVNFNAWHNNKQQIFRWLSSDSQTAVEKIRQLTPAILAAMPTSLQMQLAVGKTIEYLATETLREGQEVITAALLRASKSDFEKEYAEAERALRKLRHAVITRYKA